MRIVYLATVDTTIRYLLLDQLRHLALRGHDVQVICAPGRTIPEIQQAGIQVHPVDLTRRTTPRRDAKALWSIVKLLRALRPDLVHTHTPKAALLGQYAALLAGVPRRVHTIHGLYLPAAATGLRRRAFLVLERVTMWPAHAVLSVSAEDVGTCRRYSLCPPERLRYQGNGVDIDRFRPPLPGERLHARTALEIPDDHRVVGMVGRLVREKGVLEFITAAQSVVSRHPKTTFLIVGDRDVAKADAVTEMDLAHAGSHPWLRILGHREDMPQLYWAMDLLLHPSHREGLPYVPIEASACGLPVIATDIRGCREIVHDGVTGYLVPARDAQALADATCRLLEDETARAAFGRNGRDVAVRTFDQRIVFARVEETYARLAAVPTSHAEP